MTTTILSLGGVLLVAPASAQESAQESAPPASEADSEGSVIIVTARGREETLLDVPVSVTTYDSAAIEDANISRTDDFIALTPGVTFSNAQDAGTNFISIRGLSQTRNGEPPVAVVVDDVLQVNSRSFDQPLFDLDSIEVLRGPQGALYGRNATGGAIIINTKMPTNDFEGYVSLGGGTGGEYGGEVSVSGPIAKDAVLFRLSGSYTNRDGYFDNLFLGEKVDGLEDIALRGHLRFLPADAVTIDLRGSLVRTEAGALNYTYQPAIIDPATGLPTAFDFTINDADLVDRDFYANNLGLDDRDIDQVSLRVAIDLGFGELKSISAYDRITQSTGSDQFPYTAASSITPSPAFPFYDATQSQFFDVETFSQEVRLTSNSSQSFRWMVGGYYLDTSRFTSSSIMSDLEQGIIRIRRAPVTNPSNPLTSFIADDNDNQAWAVFFNAAYDLTDSFEISVAGRYDKDERTQYVDPAQGLYDGAGNVTGPIGQPGAVNKATFDMFQPKVTLRYQPTDTATVYASWGKGFRSGQFNPNGVGAIAAGAGVNGVSDVLPQEETETLEAGFRAQLAPRTSVSGAVYKTDLSNAPYFVFIGAVSAQVLVPIDQIDIFGVELEGSAEIADGLTAYLGVSFTDAEIKEYAVDPALVGNEAPYIASNTINAGFQYRTDISNTLGFFVRGDFENRGRQFWDPENSTARSAIQLVNARVGIEDLDGRWSFTLSGSNIFDEVYNAEFVTGGYAYAAQPDVFRADLRFNF
ncbi:TonB-dependent receptor [Citromicrobium sp. JLT1363]|uniref:TonB-dependent receptor n=1 Tax=Citromicrobium sp. JLT1363 TaxID=517722 RepID=UPI000225E941|nr:TonB-dependent receptor [Citromicrobium sp. JLT1363]